MITSSRSFRPSNSSQNSRRHGQIRFSPARMSDDELKRLPFHDREAARVLWIGNVPSDMNPDMIFDLFPGVKSVSGVRVIPSPNPQFSPYAFVVFRSITDCINVFLSFNSFSSSSHGLHAKLRVAHSEAIRSRCESLASHLRSKGEQVTDGYPLAELAVDVAASVALNASRLPAGMTPEEIINFVSQLPGGMQLSQCAAAGGLSQKPLYTSLDFNFVSPFSFSDSYVSSLQSCSPFTPFAPNWDNISHFNRDFTFSQPFGTDSTCVTPKYVPSPPRRLSASSPKFALDFGDVTEAV